ncbi:MAG: hypothetical protein GF398_21525 [Chitinivibrionales bacterium]|nr:hypothetical protein [Chitinivibrionales bacterium]
MKSAVLLLTCLFFFLLISCDDSGNNPSTGLSVVVNLMEYDEALDRSETVAFDNVQSTTVDNREVIYFSEIISSDLIPKYDNKTPDDASDDYDRRPLYAYRITGSDGYNTHDRKAEPDLTWDTLQLGYLAKENRNAGYDDGLGLPNMYYVDDVATIGVYRKIDVISPDTSYMVELADLNSDTVAGESAVSLTSLMAGVASPETNSFSIEAIDGYKKDFTWAQIQTGSLMLDSDRMHFDPGLGGGAEIVNILKITLTRI